jgi:hypothetical protein
MFAQLIVDDYFHERIWRLFGCDIFPGITEVEERQQLVAMFILERNLADEFVNPKARRGVERETWREAYERGYHTKLPEGVPCT